MCCGVFCTMCTGGSHIEPSARLQLTLTSTRPETKCRQFILEDCSCIKSSAQQHWVVTLFPWWPQSRTLRLPHSEVEQASIVLQSLQLARTVTRAHIPDIACDPALRTARRPSCYELFQTNDHHARCFRLPGLCPHPICSETTSTVFSFQGRCSRSTRGAAHCKSCGGVLIVSNWMHRPELEHFPLIAFALKPDTPAAGTSCSYGVCCSEWGSLRVT